MGLTSRQQLILSTLGGGTYVEVKDLASQLDVDVSTIRRDLQTLTRQGLVERLHGGVRLHRVSVPRAVRAQEYLAIAGATRRMLRGGERILIGGGPITDQLVPLLYDVPSLTVVTNDLRAADQLAQHPTITVLAAGGELRDAPGRATTSGPVTAAYLAEQQADWSFVEVEGIHPFGGFTTSTPWSVATARAMLAAGQRRCVLALSAAFGVRCVGFISEVAGADLIITDEQLDDYDLPAFGGKVVRAALDPDHGWRGRR
ncbi:DeoR/GlpR family DNA-binding transcription regulator [Arsenicicoccus dermatophilus]|uniref:DeoR/GlpR family DNA-binding transcription regulator n=1 Tax=Arsenicicoccus dermatophilus TaxID=1076331 RepID=UPI001F4C9B75|nr:DeoR/GlpR family DNA-binding transcription regulator [Arsenicicoccus dermatophilus]MCH8613288.1 DeoR/GlpR family DNA-binding transcription regulator [Arsenicicoccus dermatophilus]